jgi:hypothetical protein
MYNFKERFMQLITLDAIRLCKIAEIFQYSFIFLILLCIFMYLVNKFYFTTEYNIKNKINKEDSKIKKNLKIFTIVFLETFVIIIAFFYIRKIALLFPSIPNLIYPKFNPLTTLDYSIHIALVVVFIEMVPKYIENVDKLRKEIMS